MKDEDNKDYKEGSYFVFHDDLMLSNQDKSMIEDSALDFLPHPKETFAVSVGDFSALTAEKKNKEDGSSYVLVRRATEEEEKEFFGNEDEED